MICVKCNRPQAHRSHRAGLRDQWHRLFQMIPYRCQACNTRFYAYRSGENSSKMRTGEERKIMALRRRIHWKRTKKELAIYALAAAVTICILYVAIQQRFG